jgi:dehydrogenase/reductase SDR family protein 1
MAADTAIELRKFNVASISLWPGAVLTETIQASEYSARFRKMLETYGKVESAEYAGLIIAHLAQNPSLMQYSGKIVTTADYGAAYSIPDTDGQYPSNMRSISFLVGQVPALNWLSGWIPGFLKIPYWLFHQASNKF